MLKVSAKQQNANVHLVYFFIFFGIHVFSTLYIKILLIEFKKSYCV